MSDLISRLSDLRSNYNCFDENEREAYEILSDAIRVLSDCISRQPLDVQLAYYKGMADGIDKCTERLKRLNDEVNDS